MGAFSAGAVVLVRFPFSDLSQSKLRPAVVLANAGRGDYILCQITSKAQADPRVVELVQSDLVSGSLQITSYARAAKLFTANDSLVVRPDRRTRFKADAPDCRGNRQALAREVVPREQTSGNRTPSAPVTIHRAKIRRWCYLVRSTRELSFSGDIALSTLDLAAEMAAARARRAEQTARSLREARVQTIRGAVRPGSTRAEIEERARSFYPRLNAELLEEVVDLVCDDGRRPAPEAAAER